MSQFNANNDLNRALTAHRGGKFVEAINAYQAILKRSPRNARVLGLLGAAQNSIGQSGDGRRNIERAIKISPTTAQLHHDLALTYKREGNFARSHNCLDKAISIAPNEAAHRAAKGELHFMEGDHEAALRVLEPMLAASPVAPSVATLFGMVAPKAKRQKEAIDLLDAVLARPDLPGMARMKMLFTLGALHDGIDEFEAAFDAYRRGNQMHPRGFDIAQHRRVVDATIAAWNPSAIAALPSSGVDASRVIFVLGMPRSGTTLVEQILSSTDQVHPAGELGDLLRLARQLDGGLPIGVPLVTHMTNLTSAGLSKTGQAYMKTIRELKVGDRRVVDKMPLNFLNIGLIQAALPGAKVIHCRRDPLDTCLSCYFQLFDGNLQFAYDLEHCGQFHREHDRLMEHWHKTLETPILEVSYERLVGDLESVSKELFEFVDLPWTDSALRFHEATRTALTSSNAQVRQPIYSRSVGRHRHYDQHLAPLRKGLGDGAA